MPAHFLQLLLFIAATQAGQLDLPPDRYETLENEWISCVETLAQDAGLKTDMKVGHIVRGVLEACEPQEQALYEHLARDEAREWRERLDQRVFPAIRRRLSDRIIMTVLHARVSRR